LDDVEYKNRSLGIHPSSRLTAEDIQSNPMLLALLIGELNKYDYYTGSIVSDDKYGEIYDTWYNQKNIQLLLKLMTGPIEFQKLW